MIQLKKIIIVGAGASGVYLSILLKQYIKDCDVVVLEQNTTSLKKLLATGNGRCNLSNQDMSIDYYFSDCLEIVEPIIHAFDMVKHMQQLGLYTLYQGHLLYPKSEQALSVKHVLMQAAEQLGVVFLYEQEVINVQYQHSYIIKTNQHIFHADDVVFAMGSEAGNLSGIQKSRYDIFKNLKLQIVPTRPSLVQMNTKPVLKMLKGVRVKGTFSLLEDGQCIRKEKGELLFTDYGVSGIAIMQLSAFCLPNHHYTLSIDFFDEMDNPKLSEYIAQRLKRDYNHFYDGLVNSKLSAYLESRTSYSVPQIVQLLKDFQLEVVGLRNYETAQVMKGGLSLQEVDESLQIKRYPHMYAIGEILNVDGLCGGYNLHFAFASAYHVARAIEREIHVKNQ